MLCQRSFDTKAPLTNVTFEVFYLLMHNFDMLSQNFACTKRSATNVTNMVFDSLMNISYMIFPILPSTESLDTWAGIGETDADQKVDLYAALGYDQWDFQPCSQQSANWKCEHGQCGCWSTKGVAFVGGACKDYSKTSFTEYSKTTAETAMVNTKILV